MRLRGLRRPLLAVVLAGGCLVGGPCGTTTLQWKDFITTTIIRTGVTTLASVLEAATVEAATEEAAGDDGG